MKKLALAFVALALVAAACGGSGGDGVASLEDDTTADPLAAGEEVAGGDDQPSEGEVDQEQALLDFTQCMRDEGIDIPDPEVDTEGNLRPSRPEPGTFEREDVQAARETCSEFLDGVTLGFRDQDRTEIEDTLLEFAACMRDNGYDMPDPDFSTEPGAGGGPGGGGGPFGELDPDDPAFQAASEVCQDIFTDLPFGPGRGPGGGGGQGNGGGA